MTRLPVVPLPRALVIIRRCGALCFFLLSSALAGCASDKPYVWAETLPPENSSEATIRPGDHIFVLVQGQDTMSGEVQVRADGSIVQGVLGKVDLSGASPSEAARRISERLKGVVVDPRVTVAIISTSSKIRVVGEVAHPGPFEVGSNENVLDAIARAGGLTEFADKDRIFVLRRHPRLSRVRFRYSDLVGAEAHSLSFRLQDDDVVVVE